MQKRLVRISKFLSLVLRHRPEKIGLVLDEEGWVSVDELLEACRQASLPLSRAELEEVVAQNDKVRFSFSVDGTHIRANQGHSIEVNLGYEPIEPPAYLFHGTAKRFLASIQEKGLIKGNRHHVHLSPDTETARRVGQQHGRPVILKVHSADM